jgi:hypothetical protein
MDVWMVVSVFGWLFGWFLVCLDECWGVWRFICLLFVHQMSFSKSDHFFPQKRPFFSTDKTFPQKKPFFDGQFHFRKKDLFFRRKNLMRFKNPPSVLNVLKK